MRRNRIAAGLPVGTTIEEPMPKGHDPNLYYKINEKWWDDGQGSCGNWVNNNAMDTKLNGGASIVVVHLDLKTEPVRACDLEEGDYVVLSFGFWWECQLLTDARSQMLWRVAGWTSPGGSLIVDAPDDILSLVSRAEHGEEGGDRDPILLNVDDDEMFAFVTTGQEHDTWEHDWSYEYRVVETRDDV